MQVRRSLLIAVTFLLNGLAYQNAIARDLTLEDRITAQEAIERVYWDHRIWPQENRAPKPPLEGALSRTQIRARVVDYLRKSNALAALWDRPITAEELQVEMQRMAAESQAPEVLRELFAALGDEPGLIAETLARQTLADRLIREAYARDQLGDSARPMAPFDAWWADAAASEGDEIDPPPGTFERVEIGADTACVPDTWRGIPPGPVGVYGHAAVWTGSEMIVWGGDDSNGYPAGGGRYNPSTNSWTVISEVNAPARRSGYTAVWTGSEMIAWHGLVNEGGRYDPATDSWRPTSASGAPVRRGDYGGAVWTGREMILWGGRDAATGMYLNDGGRYDPVTDTWTAVTTSGAPGARSGHVVVWTGTEMLVWGGYIPALPQNGGRYDPSSDTWRLITRSGEPAQPRSGAAGAWTGSEMIIWGGEMGRYLNTGARYDPSRDTWTETSLNGVPEGRVGHSAVWTGHEMIIWGGHQGGQPFNSDGGRYNPSFNTWVRVSPLGAPIPRESSTAVWTGDEMLVWRGFPTTPGYSGRYCASTCEGATTFYKDADGDGFGNPLTRLDFCAPADGYVDRAGDCDDTNAGIHPGAVELCNLVDDNCNDRIDDAFGPGALSVNPTPALLWPPNHQMVDVHVGVTIGATCPTVCAPAVVLTSVTSSEPDDANGNGDGNTTNDIQDATVGSADFDIKLRAERDQTGSGRLYQISYTATDCFGVSASAYARVLVAPARGVAETKGARSLHRNRKK